MRKIICILLFVVFGFSGQAPADETAARFTLKSLCREANENAESIKIYKEDVEIAVQEKKRAFSVLVPRATTFGSLAEYKNNSTTSSPDSRTLGIKLTQSFTINGKELIAYDVTKKDIEKNEFTLEKIRSDYLFQVAQSYFNTLSAKRLLEVADADVQRLETHRNSVKEKLAVGSVTKTDLYRAEAELSKARTDREVADNSVIQSKAQIVRLAGIQKNFTISDDDVETLEQIDPTLDGIQALAFKNRYEIKEAEKTLEIANRTIEFEKGDFWPSLSLETGYQESDLDYGTADYDTEDAYIKAELVFTLYDGGLRKAEVRQAEAKARQADQALVSAKNDIILESEVAFSEYVTAKTSLINLQDELKSAKENFKAVQMQFKYGMADSIDMMDANTLLVQAERRISNAEYALYQAILKIYYTQGDLLANLLD